jgi:formate dehydrogenase-N beta subunit
VKTCPTGAIHFGTKKEMLDGNERVEKLKNAAIPMPGVQPAGVGGTT